ncbi:MAG: type secretion system tube protein Hcp [Verrucomicrobiales bacterium]|nr:type secretion system tube protein Hcp [Verrucomicrobiales bacterium]
MSCYSSNKPFCFPWHRPSRKFIALIVILAVRFSHDAVGDVLLNMGPNIIGESRADVAVNGWNIEIESWSWGMTRPVAVTAGKRELSPVNAKEISFVKLLDSSSPGVMNALVKGSRIPEVKLLLRQTGNGRMENFLQITLKNALVTSYNIDGSYSTLPNENFTINFTEVTLDYTPYNSAGNPGVKRSFNFNLTAPPVSGGALAAAAVADISVPGSDQLKTLLHATSEDQLQAREEVRSGTHYLAVDLARSGSDQTSQLIAQTSNDLRAWSAGTVIEEVVDATTVRYLIPMDQAQQFLRVSAK